MGVNMAVLSFLYTDEAEIFTSVMWNVGRNDRCKVGNELVADARINPASPCRSLRDIELPS